MYLQQDDDEESLEQLFSLEAEQAVLGAMLLDNNVWDKYVDGELVANDFYIEKHRNIFHVIQNLSNDKKPFDYVVVTEEERKFVGGNLRDVSYIKSLTKDAQCVTRVAFYITIVKDKSRLRALVRMGFDCARRAAQEGAKSNDIRSEFSKCLNTLNQGRSRHDFVCVKEELENMVLEIEEAYEADGSVTGLRTKLKDLDDLTMGFRRSELIVVAARPGMGKTAFVISLVVAVLKNTERKHVQFYSLRISARQAIFRLFSNLSMIPLQTLMRARFSIENWERLSDVLETMSSDYGHRLFLDDTPSITPEVLRAKASEARRESCDPPALIVVDGLQFMRTESKAENRALEIAEIMTALKTLAKREDCPVVVTTSLDRTLESRENKRPLLTDFNDFIAIEERADLVLFLYRDEIYNPNSPSRGVVEINVAKNRSGSVGIVRTAFLYEQEVLANLSSLNKREI